MKKVIEEVLEVEQKVNADIRDAQVRASELRGAADKEFSDRIAQAKEQGRIIVQEQLEKAKKEAEEQAQEKLIRAHGEREAFLSSNSEKIDHLVETVCQLVLEAGEIDERE